MEDDELEAFVETEITIAQNHIRKDARFTLIVSALCIGFTAVASLGQFYNGILHGLVTAAILGSLSYYFIRGAHRLTSERTESHTQEIKNRTVQLERIRAEKRRRKA